MAGRTVLVVVVTNAADATATMRWLAPQLSDEQVAKVNGFYAAVAAIDRGAPAVVVDVGLPDGHDAWRLVELRVRQPDAAVVVIADATLLPGLRATLSADVAVTGTRHLPPLREVLVTDEPVLKPDQTSSRRSRR
jgi:DNA-binding NarL/FixJ family response regulator